MGFLPMDERAASVDHPIGSNAWRTLRSRPQAIAGHKLRSKAFCQWGLRGDDHDRDVSIRIRPAHDHWMNSPSSGQHTATIRL